MKTISLSLFLALIVVANMLNIQEAKSATSCSARSAFGGSPDCTITCTDNTKRAHCVGGLYSATCSCVGINDPNPPRVNPSPTSGQHAVATAFASFLHNSPSSALQAMESSISDAISGASTQDWTLYWTGSDSFFSQFDNLSSTDKSSINTWRGNNGYTDPL